jgi:hypothetical protein
MIDKYLRHIQENESYTTVNLYGDKFKVQTGHDPKQFKIMMNFIKKHYKKAKIKVLQYLQGKHDPDDYGYREVKGVRNLKGDTLILDIRSDKPYFQIEWEMIPFGVVKKRNGQKIKIKYITLEIQNNRYIITPVLPHNFYS